MSLSIFQIIISGSVYPLLGMFKNISSITICHKFCNWTGRMCPVFHCYNQGCDEPPRTPLCALGWLFPPEKLSEDGAGGRAG